MKPNSKTALSRRDMLGGALTALALTAAGANARTKHKNKAGSGFVSRDGIHFKLNGETYRYVGANIWYGAYLGAPAAFG